MGRLVLPALAKRHARPLPRLPLGQLPGRLGQRRQLVHQVLATRPADEGAPRHPVEAVRARLHGQGPPALDAQPRHELDDEEQRDGQQHELQQVVEERADLDRGALDRDGHVGEVALADDGGDQLQEDVRDERLDERRERGSDDEAQRQVKHIATDGHRLELRPQLAHGAILPTPVTRAAGRSAKSRV
jgi:hypothetical protein